MEWGQDIVLMSETDSGIGFEKSECKDTAFAKHILFRAFCLFSI
jgi:hypothetical protein